MNCALMRRHVAAALAGLFAVSAAGHAGEAAFVPNMLLFPNPAPYFHNGFAQDLDAAIDFYNERFGLGLTDAEHDDLVAFLLTL